MNQLTKHKSFWTQIRSRWKFCFQTHRRCSSSNHENQHKTSHSHNSYTKTNIAYRITVMLQIGFQIDDQSLETLFLIKQRLTQSFLNTGIKIIAFRTVNIPETELGFSNINQFFIKPQKPNMNFQHGSIQKQAAISQDTENNRFFPQSDISFQKLNSSSNVANQASIYQRFSKMPKITNIIKSQG